MTRQAIQTNGAPAALGPYSQGIRSGEFVFCSGQLGLDPTTGELADGLDAAGLTFDDVVKTTIFLADVNDFAAVNAVYAKFMPEPPPARSTIGVAALPKGGLVEIEAIARRATPDAVAARRN
jgi:2-iminobutanoate/2-iminopropanoate deaminase